MSVLAQVTNGSWAMVEELSETPIEAVGALLGDDIGPVFEFERPTPVLALRPDLPGAPDALCATPDGDVLVVVAVGGESSAAIRDRLVEVVDGLRGRSLLELMDRCERIGLQHTPGSWLVDHFGDGDAVAIDRAIKEHVARGTFTLVVATRSGFEHVAIPLAELRARRAVQVRCMDLRHLAAGTVRIVEAYEVTRAELDAAATAAERRANTAELLAAARRTAGAAAEPLFVAMLRHCDAFFDKVTYRGVGELVVVEARLADAGRQRAALRFDSTGAVNVDLAWLESWDRTFLLQSVRTIVDDDELWAQDDHEPGELRLSLVDHLNDVSLVEQFVGALSDSYLATICNALVPYAAGDRFAA